MGRKKKTTIKTSRQREEERIHARDMRGADPDRLREQGVSDEEIERRQKVHQQKMKAQRMRQDAIRRKTRSMLWRDRRNSRMLDKVGPSPPPPPPPPDGFLSMHAHAHTYTASHARHLPPRHAKATTSRNTCRATPAMQPPHHATPCDGTAAEKVNAAEGAAPHF